MVAPVKKERSPSVDDESDWLEEDDYVEPFAPPAPAKRPLGGNGSTQLPSKKRKSEGGAASTADGVKGDSSHQYRQPSFTHLPAVRQHSLWREGCKRFETLSKDYALKSMTVRRAGANLDKLQDKTAIWGIVDLDQPGGAEGPCSTCMDGGIDCIVRLEPKASTSKQGRSVVDPTTHYIASRCLHCHMWNKGCDLFLTKLKTPGGWGVVTKTTRALHAAKLAPVPTKTMRSDPSATHRPQRPGPPPSQIDIPPPTFSLYKSQPAPATIPVTVPVPASASTSRLNTVESDDTACTHAVATGNTSGKTAVLAAVQDVADFAEAMRESLKRAGKLDFGAKAMVNMAEHQLETVKKFIKQCG